MHIHEQDAHQPTVQTEETVRVRGRAQGERGRCAMPWLLEGRGGKREEEREVGRPEILAGEW